MKYVSGDAVPSLPASAEALAGMVFSPKSLSCPYELWRTMRAQQPVAALAGPGMPKGGFLITKKADIDFVCSHPELFSSEVDSTVWRWGNDLGRAFDPIIAKGCPIVHTLVTADPPRTWKYRKIALDALSTTKIKTRAPKIRALADSLIAKFPEGEAFDFRTAFSIPLSLGTIMMIMGLPDDKADFIYNVTCEMITMADPSTPEPRALEAAENYIAGQNYLVDHIRRYRDTPEDNYLSFIANARDAEGALLSLPEAASIASVSLIAGNESVRNALSAAAYMLARDEALWTQVCNDREHLPAFVEEVVRLASPAVMLPRQVTQDLDLSGVKMKKGAAVYIIFGSGSRDEDVFEDPDEIKLDRKDGRYHSSFGSGVHHCAGIHLARAELSQSIEAWLEAFEAMELAIPPEDITHEASFVVRAIEALPMRVKRRARP